MALGSYETALGWLGSENRKSIIRVLFDYMQLCTSKVEMCMGRPRSRARSWLGMNDEAAGGMRRWRMQQLVAAPGRSARLQVSSSR